MKLIIDIEKKLYEFLYKEDAKGHYSNMYERMILKGIPLPKGHGRLCDLDAALKCVDNDSVTDCDAKWQAIGLFEGAMAKRVVIEADKETTDETDN